MVTKAEQNFPKNPKKYLWYHINKAWHWELLLHIEDYKVNVPERESPSLQI